MLCVFTKKNKNKNKSRTITILSITFRVTSYLEKFPVFDWWQPGKYCSQIPALIYKAQVTTKMQNTN